MAMRSWLFVPGDSETKLGKVAGYGADICIADLEDAVAPPAKPMARTMVRAWLEDGLRAPAGGSARWVRINPLDTPLWREDLAAIMPGRPHGIMVPKASGPEQLQALAAELQLAEQRNGATPGSTRILPLVSETPAAALSIPTYANAQLPRLAGLTWGAEDLSAAIGASRKRDAQGNWTDTFRHVRAQVLLTAHARGILAIDTLHAEFRDLEGLQRIATESYADGFAGMLAIHPSQVAVINTAFTPGDDEIAEARAIVNAFSANPGAGALQLEGRMLDQPHLEQARRLLERLG
ncbi:MAG: CoA ester lyase [Porphyrobacter sp.]|nr:CoA ester lyase [Porphyrobacter sp.]